jgi:hypothetical protein
MKLLLALTLLSTISFAKDKKEIKKDFDECYVTREFITTLEYLRNIKVYAVSEKQARQVAEKVSFGCSGAATRFVRTTELLVRAGLDTKSSIETGIKFAKSTQAQSDNFQHIFRQTFTAQYLDLPLVMSLKIALQLSSKFDGNQKKARDDFDKLVSFCMDKKKLELPVAFCAKTAARITALGEKFEKPIAKPFFKLFDFLVDKDGPSRTVIDALKVAELVIKNGPLGVDNFIYAYKFAASKGGLDLDDSKSITFAKNLSNRTLKLK